jgi:diguanylate cyclase (GGDEF)-like protein
MGIVFFDIDKFKHYNDTFGHIVGDDILRELGKVLAQENRAMNIVARYGGDEFVSVLSDTGTKGAKNFGKRVTHRIAEHDTLSKFGISVSFGCAEFDPATMASVNDILRAADSDMQETKALRHADLRTADTARE